MTSVTRLALRDSLLLPLLVLALVLLALPLQAAEFDHGAWDQVLKTHVHPLHNGKATQVDYANLQRHPARLNTYLDTLADVSRDTFDTWPAQEQLAFLINAYNAWTVKLIVNNYPDLDSIKDLGSWFNSPWDKTFIPLLGKQRSLNDIEHGLIRGSGRYKEPRIHFAVNCASIGCPALRTDAFDGARLEKQLEAATQSFLADRARNSLHGKTLEVSSIFKWYREDFEQEWRNNHSLRQFLAHYNHSLGMTPQQTTALLDGTIDIDFLAYDWRLNKLHR